MRRDRVEAGGGALIAYGHWGRPVLAFPAEAGRAEDFEQHGMVDAVADLIDAGRIKLYCVDSLDDWTWSDSSVPTEERAQRHGQYERWLLEDVVPFIRADCGGDVEITALGASMGAFHAANITLRHADVFPLAICLSGNYDPTQWHGWGEPGDATYFADPMAYVPNLHGDHLDWLRSRVSLLLIVGQGAFEESPTRARSSTRAFAAVLGDNGIRHELDVWGHDVPHDWPSWQRQLRHHLPRFC